MTRILLIALGVLVVAAVLFHPQPSPQASLGLGLQSLMSDADGNSPLLEPILAEDGSPVRIRLESPRLEGFPSGEETTAAAVLRQSLQRVVNQLNGAPPDPATEDWRKVILLEDRSPGESPAPDPDPDYVLSLKISQEQRGDRLLLSLTASFQGPQGSDPLQFPAEGQSAEHPYPVRSSLWPALLAIFLAIVFRKVLVSLFAGVWFAAALLTHQGQMASPWKEGVASGEWLVALGQGFLRTLDTFFYEQLVNTFRFEIIGFVIFLCAAVGVMSRAGGMQGLVQFVARLARGVRSSQLATYCMGLSIFFDDYANCILVGTTMRPVTDRLRIAREKLAFLVDATAAPVAAVCLVSTWVAYEVSTFSAQLPSVGIQKSAYAVFVETLPYRYYALFMLFFIFINILLQRDFGPMLAAERRARRSGQLVHPDGRPMVSERLTRLSPHSSAKPLARRAVLPILTVLLVTVAMIWDSGGGTWPWTHGSYLPWTWQFIPAEGTDILGEIRNVLYDGSGSLPILYGAFSGFVVALFLAQGWGARVGLVGAWVAAAKLSPQLAEKGLTAAQSQLERWQTAPQEAVQRGSEYLTTSLDLSNDGDLYTLLYYGVFLAVFSVTAVFFGFLAAALLEREPAERSGHLTGVDAFRSAIASTQALFFAVLILFLAWMIGAACDKLGTAQYLVAVVGDAMPYWSLPLVLFLISCLVSFATGSSWSTMAILLPIVVGLAYHIGENAAETTGYALLILSIGSVLEGSIFGDHCSPISDTTVLSSVSSASDHIDHVRTQMPYAVVVMLVALGCGYLPQALNYCPWWASTAAGCGALLLTLLLFGRNPNRELSPAQSAGGEDGEEPSGSDPAPRSREATPPWMR